MKTQNHHQNHHQEAEMDRKKVNIIILLFVLGMALYHIIPSQYLIGRFIYYISLYGSITGMLFHLRYISLEKKYRQFYLVASFYSIGKMLYHLWMVIAKYKYNVLKLEYDFDIFGIECELFATIFTFIAFLILVGFSLNNRYG